MDSFNGLKIIVDEAALEATTEQLFPESKNRSRRTHKKLVKRYGGEFRKVPCIWRTPTALIIHPIRYAELKQRLAHPSPTDSTRQR